MSVYVLFKSTAKFRTARIRFSDIIPRSRVNPFRVTGSNLVRVDLSFRSLTDPSSIQSLSSCVPKLGTSVVIRWSGVLCLISLCHTLLVLSLSDLSTSR